MLLKRIDDTEGNMKILQTNIHRIDMLTDTKIGDIKGLMKSLTD